jgi:hypothetical protein
MAICVASDEPLINWIEAARESLTSYLEIRMYLYELTMGPDSVEVL